MFRKEIKFIYDFNLNKVRQLGSYLTFEQIKRAEIHPAILHYISAEIDFLIFEDRQKILKDSIFDYSGEKNSLFFDQIGEEVKKNKRFSMEYIAQLILHSSSFTVNYLARPRWALMKLIFEDEEHKSTTEIKQILNYVYYYGYLKKIITSYINRKKILSLNYEEFEDLLNKIDNLGFQSDQHAILESALQSMADFFNIGEQHKHWIPLQSVELFLREKSLTEHLVAMRNTFPQGEKVGFDIKDYRKVFSAVKIVKQDELPKIEHEVFDEEKSAADTQDELIENEEIKPVKDSINAEVGIKIKKSFVDKEEDIYEDGNAEVEVSEDIVVDRSEVEPEAISDEDDARVNISEETEESDISFPEGTGTDSVDEDISEFFKTTIEENELINDEIVTEDIFDIPEDDVLTPKKIDKTIQQEPETINDEAFVDEPSIEEGDIGADEVKASTDENFAEHVIDEDYQKILEDSADKDEVEDNGTDTQHDGIKSVEETPVDEIESLGSNSAENEFETEEDVIEFYESESESVIDDFEDVEIPQEENIVDEKKEMEEIEDSDSDETEKENLESPIYDSTADIIGEDVKENDEDWKLEDEDTAEPVEEKIEMNESHGVDEQIEETVTNDSDVNEPITEDDGELSLFESFPEEEDSVPPEITRSEPDAVEKDSDATIESYTQFNDLSSDSYKEVLADEEQTETPEPVSELEEKSEEDLELQSEVDKPETEEMKMEISELLERKNMTKVIEIIFDYDIEEFANVIDNACKASNLEEANMILENLFNANRVSSASKEAEALKSIISDFFDQKEK